MVRILRRGPSRVAVVATVVILSSMLSACHHTSSSMPVLSGDADPTIAATSPTSDPATTANARATTAPTQETPDVIGGQGSFTGTSEDGKVTALITIAFGTATALSDASVSKAESICDSAVDNSRDTAAAIPVNIDVSLTATNATRITLNLQDTTIATGGSASDDSPAGWYWAGQYSDGGTCSMDNDQGGIVDWSAASPNGDSFWHGWLIDPGSASSDVGSTLTDASKVVISPALSINGESVDNLKYTPGGAVVKCIAGDPALGSSDILSVDPNADTGCSS